ncbi:S-layer family protein [Cytobacillus oceanisediminis]|uniref:S-layer family protein n=1 Tax=Cytobacillus oceanisediminis TaxID=665099 RepID=A0A2V3A5W2_9BACI|nr:S-layer homology domain-containing protein [Cytobacillus oceanisediminis]PWW31260.1 S-layer family protein [Cytobacillus oceanisediminis]
MAYQSKNHRKFLATSLTAAMVATAVAPAASFAASFPDVQDNNFYAPYVNQLADAGIIEGMPNGEFGLREKVTRAQAAKMVSLIRDLDLNAAAASFEDVKQDAWYAKYINALYAEKLVDGVTETEFAPNGTLTRAQFAKLVVDAYGLELQADAKTPFTDVKEGVWYTDYIKTLYANDLINGKTPTTFEPNATIDRADFAKLLVDADLEFGFTLGNPAVTGVSAVSPNTLKLEGTALKNIKASDLSVEGNKVTAVTPSADGKSALITLEGSIAPNTEVTLKATLNGTTKEFTVKFEYKVEKATVNAGLFDDDTKGQKVTFKINSESSAASVDYLKLAGYTVKFVAVDSDGASADIFKDNTTGELKDSLTKGDYEVEVQVTKGGTLVKSERETISVVNLEQVATAVKSVELTNGKGFVMNSKTLVAGETADVTEVISTIAGDDVDATANATVESSNQAAVSVSGKTLTANAAGKATITVTVGNSKSTFDVTVTNSVRKVTKVAPSTSSVKLITGKTTDVSVIVTDQYGDPFNTNENGKNELEEVVPSVLAGSYDLDTNNEGKVTLTLTAGSNAGTGTLYFKDANNNVLGSFNVQVTKVDNVGTSKLELKTLANQSKDNTLDVNNDKDNKVTYALNKYTTEGVYNGSIDLAAGNYSVESLKATVATAAISGTDLTITAKGKGQTDVVLKDSAGAVVGKITITVVDEQITITKVDFKATSTVDYIGETININDVFDIVASDDDEIVKGITLSKSTLHKVRIESDGDLYLDTDGDGQFNNDDVQLATVTAEVATGATGLAVGTFDPVTGISTTASGQKGTIIFKVMEDSSDATTAIASTSVTVNVK